MTADALTSPEIALLRSRVPEFDRALQDELRKEDGQVGPFQAASILSDWVLGRLRESPDDDAARRTFGAVEELITDNNFQLGSALAAEIIEGVWKSRVALALMGPRTRERAEPTH